MRDGFVRVAVGTPEIHVADWKPPISSLERRARRHMEAMNCF